MTKRSLCAIIYFDLWEEDMQKNFKNVDYCLPFVLKCHFDCLRYHWVSDEPVPFEQDLRTVPMVKIFDYGILKFVAGLDIHTARKLYDDLIEAGCEFKVGFDDIKEIKNPDERIKICQIFQKEIRHSFNEMCKGKRIKQSDIENLDSSLFVKENPVWKYISKKLVTDMRKSFNNQVRNGQRRKVPSSVEEVANEEESLIESVFELIKEKRTEFQAERLAYEEEKINKASENLHSRQKVYALYDSLRKFHHKDARDEFDGAKFHNGRDF